jgi:hypothetical protein
MPYPILINLRILILLSHLKEKTGANGLRKKLTRRIFKFGVGAKILILEQGIITDYKRNRGVSL